MKKSAAFDPKIFLEGKTISEYGRVKLSGAVADAVFYIQKGEIKLTVISKQGKEAVVGLLGSDHFLAKDVSMATLCVRQRLRRSMNA